MLKNKELSLTDLTDKDFVSSRLSLKRPEHIRVRGSLQAAGWLVASSPCENGRAHMCAGAAPRGTCTSPAAASAELAQACARLNGCAVGCSPTPGFRRDDPVPSRTGASAEGRLCLCHPLS